MQVVELDIAYFRAAYPQFADADAVPDAMLERLWSEAGILVDNTAASSIPARDPSGNPRKAILYALLCHLATLETRGEQTQCGATAWELLRGWAIGPLYFPGC